MTGLALPEPAAGSTAAPARRPVLAQCLVLAALLHLLVVLVFGNAPGGSARPGEGLWGAFQVRLVGVGPAGRADAAAPELPRSGPPGQAERQRFGGAVRPAAAPPPADEPGAARAGRWLARAAEADAQAPPLAAAELPARQSADAGRPLPAADAPSPAVADQPQPAPPATEAALPARQGPRPAAPPAMVLADPGPTAALQVPPLPGFQVQPMPAPRVVAAPPVQRSLAPLSSADLPVPPAPLPAVPSFAVQAAPPPRPLAQRERPSAVTAPAPADWSAAAADAPPLPSFVAQPLAPARAVVARDAPPAVTPPAPADLALQTADSPALPQFAVAMPDAAAAPAGAARPALATRPAQAGALPASPTAASPMAVERVAGAPDAGANVGHDIATAPSQAASAARLNLDLARPRGGAIAAQGSRGLLSVLPHPPERKTKLEKEIELSGLADCRQAYSAMGLAAVAPLVADALRGKGCRW